MLSNTQVYVNKGSWRKNIVLILITKKVILFWKPKQNKTKNPPYLSYPCCFHSMTGWFRLEDTSGCPLVHPCFQEYFTYLCPPALASAGGTRRQQSTRERKISLPGPPLAVLERGLIKKFRARSPLELMLGTRHIMLGNPLVCSENAWDKLNKKLNK